MSLLPDQTGPSAALITFVGLFQLASLIVAIRQAIEIAEAYEK